MIINHYNKLCKLNIWLIVPPNELDTTTLYQTNDTTLSTGVDSTEMTFGSLNTIYNLAKRISNDAHTAEGVMTHLHVLP